MSDLSTVGKRLAFARSQNHLLQKDLAAILGLRNTAQISQWENDEFVPRSRRLDQLAQALGTTTTWILNDSGEPPEEHSGPNARWINERAARGRGEPVAERAGWLVDAHQAVAKRFERDMARLGADDYELDHVRAVLESPELAKLLYRREDGSPKNSADARAELDLYLRVLRYWVRLHMKLRAAGGASPGKITPAAKLRLVAKSGRSSR